MTSVLTSVKNKKLKYAIMSSKKYKVKESNDIGH